MSNTDFLGRAIDTVKKAIDHDNAGEYEKAYQTYYSALELFMLALKWEKNPKSKEMIRAKTGEYMDRAEKLKNHLANNEGRKKPSAVGANGKVANGSGKGYGHFFSFYCLTLFPLHEHITPPARYLIHHLPPSILFSSSVELLTFMTATERMMTIQRMLRPRNFVVPYKVLFYQRNLTCDGKMSRVSMPRRKP
jgi:hypothetical protein